jgi:hypothetical protein
MARQGGPVQLKQFDMHLALNMAKMAKGGFSRTAMEQTQQLFKKPCAEVREEKKQAVEFPGHNKVNAAIESHSVMVCKLKRRAASLAKIAPPHIHILAGCRKARVNL